MKASDLLLNIKPQLNNCVGKNNQPHFVAMLISLLTSQFLFLELLVNGKHVTLLIKNKNHLYSFSAFSIGWFAHGHAEHLMGCTPCVFSDAGDSHSVCGMGL